MTVLTSQIKEIYYSFENLFLDELKGFRKQTTETDDLL